MHNRAIAHCTAQPEGYAHLFKPTRGPARPDAPEDQEQCSMCNAIRRVPYEIVSEHKSFCIFKRRNLVIGGYDYYSDSLGVVTKIVDASTDTAELAAILAAMLGYELVSDEKDS